MSKEIFPLNAPEDDPEKSPLQRITWIDTGIAMTGEWLSLPQILGRIASPDSMLAVTVGWTIHSDNEITVMAQTYDKKHNMWMNAQIIHTPAIRTIETLHG